MKHNWNLTIPLIKRLGYSSMLRESLMNGEDVEGDIRKLLGEYDLRFLFSKERSIIELLRINGYKDLIKDIYEYDSLGFIKNCKRNSMDYRILLKYIDNPS